MVDLKRWPSITGLVSTTSASTCLGQSCRHHEGQEALRGGGYWEPWWFADLPVRRGTCAAQSEPLVVVEDIDELVAKLKQADLKLRRTLMSTPVVLLIAVGVATLLAFRDPVVTE